MSFGGGGITVTVQSRTSTTTIVVNLHFTPAATTGDRDVTVTNGDTQSDTLANGFRLDP